MYASGWFAKARSASDLATKAALWAAAFLWRRILFRTTFIAVTGSFGKTAAKDLLAAILATRGPTVKTPRNRNGIRATALTILRTRPWHRYAVVEIATAYPGQIRRKSWLVRPRIGVIIGVGGAHAKSFPAPADVAAEKAALLRALPPAGIAVVNADGPSTASMPVPGSCRLIRFGTSAGCDLRWEEPSAVWPDRLSFRVAWNGQSRLVRTRLVGEHWIPSVMAALAAAQACGVAIDDALAPLGRVEPFLARLQPVELPSGAVILRDEYNFSEESWLAAARVLRDAAAGRRILVFCDISDCRDRPRDRLKRAARFASEHTDLVLFLGERAEYAAGQARRCGMGDGAALAFADVPRAVSFLRRELRRGDLVLVRSYTGIHPERILFSLLGEISCGKSVCGLRKPCDECKELGFLPSHTETPESCAG
jgi:UDP-N-acetylmuramoyl-tripeptide--D-alanyl-D-alanine ligase